MPESMGCSISPRGVKEDLPWKSVPFVVMKTTIDFSDSF